MEESRAKGRPNRGPAASAWQWSLSCLAPANVSDKPKARVAENAADAPQHHAAADIGYGICALDAVVAEHLGDDRRQPDHCRPYREQGAEAEHQPDHRAVAVLTVEQLQR